MIGAEDHGIGAGLFITFPGILADQQNVQKVASGTADPFVVGISQRNRGEGGQYVALGYLLGLRVLDLIQKMPEDQCAAQHHSQDKAQQSTKQLHGDPAQGISWFHR